MRKKLTSVLLFSALVLGASMGVQSEPEPETMTVCYYGVTMTVKTKIAKRYLKLGATMGACGEQGEPGSGGPTGPTGPIPS